jgi:hypothetical protein
MGTGTGLSGYGFGEGQEPRPIPVPLQTRGQTRAGLETRAIHYSTTPTEDTISFYVVYMSHHISPRSVTTYLSGIVQQLEPFYPLIHEIRNSKLVQRTLQGCLKTLAQPTRRKRALSISDLTTVLQHYSNTLPSHDNLLFVAMLLTGFFSLM